MSGRPHKSLFAPRGLAGLVFAGCTAAAIVTYSRIEPAAHAESSQDLIEQAIYTREEFFGAEAVIPVPTAEARENLLGLLRMSPNAPAVIEKLSELEEKLGNYDTAENDLKQLVAIDKKYEGNLTVFYERRGRYADEAVLLRQRLATADEDERAALFETLLDTARTHDLKEYLRPEFYRKVVSQNGDVYLVFEKLIEQLTNDEEFDEALRFVRQAEGQYPDKKADLLEKEIKLLGSLNNNKEAARVYIAAFDPFWTKDESEKFYEYLSENDGLLDYASSLKKKFTSDPADFDTAIRLASYRAYRSQDVTPVFAKLENAKTNWTVDELLTVTRVLFEHQNLQLGSRYLYTLYNRPEMKTSGAARSRILYQLFRTFSDAQNQKLPITRGDLDYYRQIASVDTDPGIATGILSLLFSDTNPRSAFDQKEVQAGRYFNRAAAYRIFLAYKKDNSTTPELAAMYLDIVRLYTATEQIDIARQALDEFSTRYKRTNDFRAVALKLAFAYAELKQVDKTREIYREVLASYDGENIDKLGATRDGPNTDPAKKLKDVFSDGFEAVTYGQALELLVDSLAKDKLTTDIIALYSTEISKHQDAEWLYEARLKWLDQTNLTDDQLAAYKQALDKFQSSSWRDKLARWLIRHDRQADFDQYSTEIVSKLDEGETQSYLAAFTNGSSSAKDFEKKLYLRLYQSALARFPHNEAIVTGLLNFYSTNKHEDDWRKLAATYYFEMPEVRKLFVSHLAEKKELRKYLATAPTDNTIYKLFRADASMHLSEFENAVASYRDLNRLYPNTPDFVATLITLDRSFGQKDTATLTEGAEVARSRADFEASSSDDLTRSGEIYAELGDFKSSRLQWGKIITTAPGDKETYLETATVFWDYFQYKDALQVIDASRKRFDDDALCSFEAGAIQESLHDKPASIREYVAALGLNDQDESYKAAARLAKLANANKLSDQITAAFAARHAQSQNTTHLTLGYANYLVQIDKPDDAVRLLTSEIASSNDDAFLSEAQNFAYENELKAVDHAALKRLAEITETPRRKIGYAVELADSLRTAKKRDEAEAVLADLVKANPTNYGVIVKASDMYRQMGFDEDSLSVLKNALPLSKGQYTTTIAAKLSKRLIELNRLDEAEQILTDLHVKEPANIELFHELAQVYVRKARADLLETAFKETVEALKKSDIDRRELDEQIADLRTEMIDAFTRLKDYHSAVEQHIEIINREPDDEELVSSAIAYATRYGGGDQLLAYYQKTATEAFKNYRWNVVLARIYEANGDIENAIGQYRTAMVSQPEMAELYLATADLEMERQNYDAALKNVDTILALTNYDPVYIRKKIAILKKAGRNSEALAEQAKLPSEKPVQESDDQFSRAESLAAKQKKDEARAAYRKAFDALINDPLHGDMTTADIAAYIRSIREEESLDKITPRLWMLRDKLQAIAAEPESANAGEARKRISLLDGAIVETVGSILKTYATDDEIKAVFDDLSHRIDSTQAGSDGQATLDLIQNLSRKAGLGALEEKVLKGRIADAPADIRVAAVRNLVSFYDARGAYARSFETVEQSGIDDAAFVADHARLAGQRDKEMDALRRIYEKPAEKLATTADTNVARYLELLYASNRDELSAICRKSSVYQLQLINFLLGKGERDLAHQAIESSNLPEAWKLSRNAETALVFREYGNGPECYFCDALQLDTIGNMISQVPDKQRFLVANDWFRLTREYGEWLYHEPQKANKPSLYLTALTELRPHSAEAQDELGTFYLDEKQVPPAVEHFRIAYELDPKNTTIMSDLGAAYYIAGTRQNAEEMWKRALDDASPDQLGAFFDSLSHFGLEAEARTRIAQKIVKFLEKKNIDENNEAMERLVRDIAASFDDKRTAAAYFSEIINQRPSDTSLAEFVIDESLLDGGNTDPFYQRLITQTPAEDDGDYEFRSVMDRAWSYDDAEWIYDQENDYEIAEPAGDHYEWRKKYTESLIERHQDAAASAQIAALETELHGNYARPDWLKIEKMRLALRANNFAIANAERFVGVTVSSSVKEVRPPDIDRYNDVVKMLRDEKASESEQQLAEAFFARNLALGEFDKTNFDGFARTLLQKKDTAVGVRILQLMVNAADEDLRPTALSELNEQQEIKERVADRTGEDATIEYSVTAALELAARTAGEFGLRDAAISFRRELLDAEPANADNRIELSQLLMSGGDRGTAARMLGQLAADINATRADRWRAMWQLHAMDPNTILPDIEVDALSQMYVGRSLTKDPKPAEEHFVRSLIAANDQTNAAADELIETYAATGKQHAALKLADTFKHDRSDELIEKLSIAAEEIGDLEKAISYERARSDGGDQRRVGELQHLLDIYKKRAVDLKVDTENTREL